MNSPDPAWRDDAIASIRARNEAANQRDLEGAAAPYAADTEWDTTGAFPDGEIFTGLPAVRAYWSGCNRALGRDDHRTRSGRSSRLTARRYW